MSELKPAAWLHKDRPDSDVITDKVKHVHHSAGSVVGRMAAYSIPLYTGEQLSTLQADIDRFIERDVEYCQTIVEQDAEIARLQAQVERMPVCKGYVAINSIHLLRDGGYSGSVFVKPEKNDDYPCSIYIDPEGEGESATAGVV